MTQRRQAFTVLELLMVIGIMAGLTGSMFSIIGIATRKAKKTATQTTLMKLDQAVRLFKSDAGVYPCQTDMSNADADATQWTNNLGYRLAWRPEHDDGDADLDDAAANRTTYRSKMQADISAIHACFKFVGGKKIGQVNGDGSHAFRNGDYYSPADASFLTNLLLSTGTLALLDSDFTTENGAATGYRNGDGGIAFVLTSMAEEITTLHYLAGQLPVQAPQGLDPANATDKALRPNLDARYTTLKFSSPFVGASYQPAVGTHYSQWRYVPYNKLGAVGDDSRGPALTAVAAQAKGWRGEYLADVLSVQRSSDTAGDIAYSSSTPPDRSVVLDAYGNPIIYVCRAFPGARGFRYGLGGSTPDEADYGMTPITRDTAQSLASDLRTSSTKPFVAEFELWSAGPDGRFASLRNASDNNDNIPAMSYNKGLQ